MEDLQQQCTQQQQQGAARGVEGTGSLACVADVVIDALFGFSFKGTPRAPFDTLIKVNEGYGGGVNAVL
jgi:NAD(P)H-hydrate repair Nnr-like enzyme with NAD(P)H-hydrate epimerase domain